MTEGLARAVVWVEGHVQGVGFRWWCYAQATRLGLSGSARNLHDERVEIDVQGLPDDVAEMVRRATGRHDTRGRPGRVTGYLVERRAPDPSLTGFDTH